MAIKSTLMILALASIGGATTITFVGAPTGVNDGSFYVLPYQLMIGGGTQDVTCYDFLDEVGTGDVWQANVLDIADAATSGFFPGASLASYERIAWLSAQTYTDTAEQIGLQYAIWDVFDSSSPTSTDAGIYEAAADTAAAGNYANFSFSRFEFIQEIGATAGESGTEQAFVYQVAGVFGNASPIPEPETITLFVAGIVLMIAGKLKWWRRRGSNPHEE